jgi:hypothetical protein
VSDVKLHRFHMVDQSSRLQFDHPTLGMTWRADGRYSLDLKNKIAHRLAVCWNVLEGIPTEALMKGMLLELCKAIDAGDMQRAKAVLATMDRAVDNTDGRPHDCVGCLKREAETNTEVVDPDDHQEGLSL